MNTLTNKRTGARGLAMLLSLTLCAALGVVAVSATPALAKTYNEKWTVEFTGDKMVDEGTANITKTLSGMQPGDSACFTIQLKEGPQGNADWYMRNKVLSTMEDSFANANERSGGSYSYKLTYRNPKGEDKIILTNEVVSGDKGTGETKGLFDATDATGEWFFLEDLAPNATAWMMLEVSIDGETHGNTYFDTDASVQLAFAAEPTEEPGTPGNPEQPDPGDPKQDPPKKDDQKSDTPKDNQQKTTDKADGKLSQTGDMLPIGIIVAVAVIAAGVVIVAAVRSRKKDHEEDDAR